MFAIGTGEEQLGGRLVRLHDEMEVLHCNLAGAATAAVCHGAALAGTEAPGLDLHPAVTPLVLGVRRFGLWNAFDLQKIVNRRHEKPSST